MDTDRAQARPPPGAADRNQHGHRCKTHPLTSQRAPAPPQRAQPQHRCGATGSQPAERKPPGAARKSRRPNSHLEAGLHHDLPAESSHRDKQPRQTPHPAGQPLGEPTPAPTPPTTQTTTRQKEEILTARPVQTRLLPNPQRQHTNGPHHNVGASNSQEDVQRLIEEHNPMCSS
jgi:hypothetical protein